MEDIGDFLLQMLLYFLNSPPFKVIVGLFIGIGVTAVLIKIIENKKQRNDGQEKKIEVTAF